MCVFVLLYFPTQPCHHYVTICHYIASTINTKSLVTISLIIKPNTISLYRKLKSILWIVKANRQINQQISKQEEFRSMTTYFCMFNATFMGKDAVPCPESVCVNYPFQASIRLNFCTKSLLQDKVLKNVIPSLSVATIVTVAEQTLILRKN